MKKVQVLMSTYNGDKYLREQLDSILSQIGVDVDILVRDDGSTDGTIGILEEYKKACKLNWYSSVNLGVKKSFLDLLQNSSNKYDYYAFSDQDDVWLENKLVAAIERLNLNKKLPQLYFSRTMQVDANLQIIKAKEYSKFGFAFSEVLIKNNATGCTMVFNNYLARVINSIDYRELALKPLHDHWLYMVCLAVDGNVVFDDNSYIKYRQHSNNVVGGGRTIIEKIKDHSLFNKGNIKQLWALELLEKYKDVIDDKNLEILYLVVSYKRSIKHKIKLVKIIFKTRFSLIEKLLLALSIVLSKY